MSVPQLSARAARRADPRRLRHRLRRAAGRRPGRVPGEVPEDGGLRLRLLPGHGVPLLRTTWTRERRRRPVPGRAHRRGCGSTAICTRRTSARYMDANGRLIFNVNDFDEAYVGPFTWDLKRFAASVALIGYAKALSDEQITELVADLRGRLPRAHPRPGHRRQERRGAAVHPGHRRGPAAGRAARRPLADPVRAAGLDDGDPRLRAPLRRRRRLRSSWTRPPATRCSPRSTAIWRRCRSRRLTRPDSYRVKDVVGRRGIGIGSAGLPSYNILLEGNSDALENDVVIYIKQAQTPAVSRHITDPAVRELLPARGPPHGDLAARPPGARRPVAGLDRAGRRAGSWSPRSRRTRWTWTGRDIDDPEEIAAVVADLGRATATMHAAADDESGALPGAVLHGAGHRRGDRGRRGGLRGPAGRLRPQLRRTGARATTRSSWTSSATAGSRVCRRPLRPVHRLTGDLLGVSYRSRGTLSAAWTYPGPSSEPYARRCSRRSS